MEYSFRKMIQETMVKKKQDNLLPALTTRKGDHGYTGLLRGRRVPKNSPQIHLIGLLDEFSVLVGKGKLCGYLPWETAEQLQKDMQAICYRIVSQPAGRSGRHKPYSDKLVTDNCLFIRLKELETLRNRKGLRSLIGEIAHFSSLVPGKDSGWKTVRNYVAALKDCFACKKEQVRSLSLNRLLRLILGLLKEHPELSLAADLLMKISKEKNMDRTDLKQFEKHYADFAKGLVRGKNFLLPGRNARSLKFDYCRVKIREYERKADIADPVIRIFVNRLSDYFFCRVLQADQHGF
jgi:cob(I)alamin adenosyltransferase